jgi:hypothetical protein
MIIYLKITNIIIFENQTLMETGKNLIPESNVQPGQPIQQAPPQPPYQQVPLPNYTTPITPSFYQQNTGNPAYNPYPNNPVYINSPYPPSLPPFIPGYLPFPGKMKN